MGNFLVFMTLLLGIKFIVKPVMTTKEDMTAIPMRIKIIKSVFSGMVAGFICGFVGAGGGMMVLLLLTSMPGYELKTAVGTSVFYYDVYDVHEFVIALCNRRYARLAAVFALRSVYAYLCANRSRTGKQCKHEDLKPCNRCDIGFAMIK